MAEDKSYPAPNIYIPATTQPKVDPGKSGEYYDRCPLDGCMEVERNHKLGGHDSRGEEHLLWSTYTADPRRGGCGHSWSRTTKQGLARNDTRNRSTAGLTRAADRDVITSVPSQAYRDNYDRAFQKGEFAPKE